MPNWCVNTVEFYADAEKISVIQNFFQEMSKMETRTMHGQLPSFVNEQRGWLFEIDMEDEILHYQTKWAPNLSVIKQVADHFKCGFHYTYDEPGMQLFGEISYREGVLKACWMENTDYDLFEMDEENLTYTFEGKVYESEYDIFEIILERKEEVVIDENF